MNEKSLAHLLETMMDILSLYNDDPLATHDVMKRVDFVLSGDELDIQGDINPRDWFYQYNQQKVYIHD